jgi:two-component system KDP operon response regulator KdpE
LGGGLPRQLWIPYAPIAHRPRIPFDSEELLARLRAALRSRIVADGGEERVTIGDISIDRLRREVRVAGDLVHLTPKEFALLGELARHPGRVLTHAALLRAVWGEAHAGDVEYLRVTVRALRQKLDQEGADSIIRNDPGVGYRLYA